MTTNQIGKSNPEIREAILALTGERSTASRVLNRRQLLIAVWCYAGALCILLGSVEFFVLRSFELLVPIVGICAAGGLIGTYFALFEGNT